MGRGVKGQKGKGHHGIKNQDRACQLIDDLAEFETFQHEILPALRKDIESGMPYREMERKYLGLAAARKITIALREPDSSKALAAIKDMQDRADGKPTEHRVNTHKFQALPDEELDAVLKSEIAELED